MRKTDEVLHPAIYNNVLSPQQTTNMQKYQDFKSKVLISALLVNPDGFLLGVEQFGMSVIFRFCYNARLAELHHSIMPKFYSI